MSSHAKLLKVAWRMVHICFHEPNVGGEWTARERAISKKTALGFVPMFAQQYGVNEDDLRPLVELLWEQAANERLR